MGERPELSALTTADGGVLNIHQWMASNGSSFWIARLRDSDPAGLVTRQDGDALYAKINARSLDCPNGGTIQCL